jgi:Yip1-like protein
MFTSKRLEETMNADTAQIEGSAPAGTLPEAPQMSAPETLVGIFTKPKQTFQALEHKPRILAPFLVVLVFQIVFGFVAMQSGIQKADTLHKLEQKNAPPEQIEAVTNVMDSPARFLFILGGPIVLSLFWLVTSAILYFIANLMLGARLRFTHYLCIVAYGWVVGILDQAAQMGVALSRGTLFVSLGIGAFMGDELNGLMRILDAATDPLLLWVGAIEALGIAVMARKSFGFGILAVAPVYVLAAVARGLLR